MRLNSPILRKPLARTWRMLASIVAVAAEGLRATGA
jgi:hypothetical protein